MAKQDLVVKLLLDSGAFGTDIREAERQAKQFSDNMRNAGKTAGDLGKELGITTGALGKLGGVMAGAAGVVALFGAFKSVMESSHTSAKKFHGVMAGFSGVLDAFQTSLATSDFSAFNQGLEKVYENAKRAKEAIMDAQVSSVAYGFINKEDKKRLKELEVAYRNPDTTDENREMIKAEAERLLKNMHINAKELADALYKSVLNQLQAKQPNLPDMNKEDFLKQMRQAMLNILLDYDEEEKEAWKPISDEITKLGSKYTSNKKTAEQYYLQGGSQKGKAKKNWFAMGDDYMSQANAYKNQLDELSEQYKDIMLRNVLYEIPAEHLKELISEIEEAYEILTAIEDLQLQVGGWTPPAKPKVEPEPLKGSIAYEQKKIAELTPKRDRLDMNSEEWKKLNAELQEHIDKLAELEAKQEELNRKNKPLEGSIAYEEEQIKKLTEQVDILDINSEAWKAVNAELQEHIKELERLKDLQDKINTVPAIAGSIADLESKIKELTERWKTMDAGTPEWKEATDQLKKYQEELDKLLETLKGKEETISALPKSIADLQAKIAKAQSDRNNAVVGSDDWWIATTDLYNYMDALKTVIKQQEEFDAMFETNDDKRLKRWSDMNYAISSTAVLINGLGDAFDTFEGAAAEALSGVMDMMSTVAQGIMSYIQIQQAAAAASGTASAAAMPFPYNLAAIATVTGTIMSVFANIKKIADAGKFAEGGIVGGTSYSGDKLFAMVNSGEMILNKRQQRNLGNMLGGGGQVEFHISGDSLVGVLNNKRNKTNLTR